MANETDAVLKIVGDLFDVVKALADAAERRGERLDKKITERLSSAERALYDERKAAYERANSPAGAMARLLEEKAERERAAQAELQLSNPDASVKELAEALTEDADENDEHDENAAREQWGEKYGGPR